MIMTTNMRRLQAALEITAIIILGFIILCSCMLIYTAAATDTPNVFGYSMGVVSGGSMEPTFKHDEMLLLQTVDEDTVIWRGTVVVYDGVVNGQKTRIVHRVVDVYNRNGTIYYVCKGDANEANDPPITRNQIKYIVLS